MRQFGWCLPFGLQGQPKGERTVGHFWRSGYRACSSMLAFGKRRRNQGQGTSNDSNHGIPRVSTSTSRACGKLINHARVRRPRKLDNCGHGASGSTQSPPTLLPLSGHASMLWDTAPCNGSDSHASACLSLSLPNKSHEHDLGLSLL